MYNKKQIGALLVVAVLLISGVGMVSGATWENSLSDDADEIAVLQGTEDSAQNYTAYIDGGNYTVDDGNDFMFVSNVNPDATNNTFTMTGSGIAMPNGTYTVEYNNQTRYVTEFNVTEQGDIFLTQKDGVIFGTEDDAANGTVSTQNLTEGTVAVAGISPEADDGTLVFNTPENLTNNVSYRIVDHPIDATDAFADSFGDIQPDNDTVDVTVANETATLTHTLNVSENAENYSANTSSVEALITINSSLANDSTVDVNVTNGNATVVGTEDRFGSDYTTYVVQVNDTNNTTTVESTVTIDNATTGDEYDDAIFSTVDYDADTVGTEYNEGTRYTVALTESGGTGMSLISVPGLFVETLGETLGSAVFWLVIVGSVVNTALLVLLLSRKDYLTTGKRKAGAYGGGLLGSFGAVSTALAGNIAWITIAYFSAITAAVAYLYFSGSTATTGDGGEGGNAEAIYLN